MKTVSWFSAGVSSAVATKLLINQIDEIIYTHIDDQHPDTIRFALDCEKWFGKKITVLRSPYKSVEDACLSVSYINGVAGASCTRLLKRRVRQDWELSQKEPLRYVWGLDANEANRAERIVESMPNFDHDFPLIAAGLTKQNVHKVLLDAGISRPKMYDLGYSNNNCIGCVKGGMGYWNKVRVDFPEVFKSRALLERRIGASCINGVFLDELDPERGKNQKPIVGECGILCELLSQDF